MPIESTLLTLISTYLANALVALPYFLFPQPIPTARDTSKHAATTVASLSAFVQVLNDTPTLLQWIPYLSSISKKHADSILTRVYSGLTKSTSSLTASPATARSLFLIRLYAISCLAHSSIVDNPDNFWDQASKFGAAYVKSVATADSGPQAEMAGLIASAFMKLVSFAKQRRDREIFLHGKGFLGFCEYWMEFANKVRFLFV